MRAALAILCLAGCGRIAFDPIGGASGDAMGDDGGSDDSMMQVVCGDGVCSGNAGEWCTNCTADCMTKTAVCGNGACDPGESPDCYADCGPSPWTWSADEQAILDTINTARMNGMDCGTGTITSPALAFDANLRFRAREWAWEKTYQGYSGGYGCNGRTVSERIPPGTAAWIALFSSASAAASFFLSDPGICPNVMSSANTLIGVGAVSMSPNTYIIFLD